MTDRKTLQLRDPSEQSDDTPAIKKKGRGWEISEKRLDALHERAREMRRFSSDAHKALAKRFAEADMGPYTFKRHAVVGSAIVDFACHKLGMAIDIDEEGENETLAKRRDKSLEAVGIDDVLPRITAGMRMRIADKREARAAHRAQGKRDRPAPESPTQATDESGGEQ